MILFNTETARLQYALSAHEVLPPFGPLLAYVQSSQSYYEPKSAGRGDSHWRFLGHAVNRAHGGVGTTKRDEVIADSTTETVLAGDIRYVVGDLIVDGDLVLTETGQIVFLDDTGTSIYVASDDTKYVYGDITLDDAASIDGELVFLPDVQTLTLPLTPTVVAEGTTYTIPANYALPAAHMVLQVDGDIVVDGEIV